MTISDYVRAYAKEKNISCAGIERQMGWGKDTIRKMQAREISMRRIRDLALVYTDLYDVVPELREIVCAENGDNIRDIRIKDLEKIVEAQNKLIKSLEAQIKLMEEK